MKEKISLTQKDFDALLDWFSDDREEAGKQYEKIREGLIRFFRFRGCADPHELVDETINRVAVKVLKFDDSKNVKTITYFYGFASHIFMEYLKKVKTREVSLDPEIPLAAKKVKFSDEIERDEGDCLEHCLAKLSVADKKLVLDYYSKEKSEKLDVRKAMAAALNLKPNALYMKVHRVKSVLKDCIEKCLDKK